MTSDVAIEFVHIQGEAQNKISQHENCYISEMPEYFLHQISLICLSQYCAIMYCFLLYLLDICQIDGNANFKNEFHN